MKSWKKRTAHDQDRFYFSDVALRALRRRWIAGAVSMGALVLAAPALAQQSGDVDQIIVTAQKREQNVKDVPISVSVFQEGLIRSALIEDAEDIEKFVPGMSRLMNNAPRFSRTFIRGVGSIQTATASDASVGYYVDDVLVPKILQGIRLFDVEQIEVLRGPQGTLFGRGAQAGVINIRTKRPEPEFGGSVHGSVGSQDFYNVGGVLNAPLTEQLAVRFGGAYETVDEDLENLSGEDGRARNTNLASTLFYEPADVFSVELGFQYSRDQANYPVNGGFRINGERVFSRDPADNDAEGWIAYARLAAEIGSLNLVSISSYANTENLLRIDDTDSIDLPFLPSAIADDPTIDFSLWEDKETEFSQEVRLTPTAGAVDWILGATYYSNDFDSLLINNDFNVAAGLLDGVRDHNIDRSGFAFFGDATAPIVDGLSITGGVRYAKENQDLRHVYTPLNGNLPSDLFGLPPLVELNVDEQEQSYDAVTGRVALSYDWNDNTASYISYSRGHKTGGFPNFVIASAYGESLNRFNEAFINAYEAGVKYQSSDGAFFGSAAAFFNDVKDEQVSGFDPSIPFLVIYENIDAETYGVELELSYSPMDNLDFFGAFSYVKAEATSDASTIMTGDRILGVPELTGSFFVQYTEDFEVGGRTMTLTPNLDLSYVGDRTSSSTGGVIGLLDPYVVVNTSLTFGLDAFSLILRAENLFNEDYELVGRPNTTLDSFMFGRVRLFSATLRADF